MASGSFNVSSSNGYIAAVCYWSSTPDTASNTSAVHMELRASRTNNYTTYGTGNYSMNMSGQEGNGSATVSITLNSNTLICAMDRTAYHAADGTCTITLGVSFSISGVLTLGGSWGTFAIDTIPRTSQVSLDNNNIWMRDSTMMIRTNRMSASFTHNIYYMFGGGWVLIASGVTDWVQWTPPIDLADVIPNSASGQGAILCETYNGGTYIGNSQAAMWLSVPTDIVPTISAFTATRVDGNVPSAWALYLQNYSKATFNVSATAPHSATVTSITVTGQNANLTGASGTSDFITTSGTLTYTARVTDSRGRVTTATLQITVVPYVAPTIDGTAVRCTSGGALQDDGTYLKITPTATFASCSSKNAITLAAYYKRANAVDFITISGTLTNNTASAALTGGAISAEYSYDVKLVVTDAMGNTAECIIKVTSLFALISFLKEYKRGMAIGKQCDTDNLLDIALPTKVNGNYVTGVEEVTGLTSDGVTIEPAILNAIKDGKAYTLIGSTTSRADGTITISDISSFDEILVVMTTGGGGNTDTMVIPKNNIVIGKNYQFYKSISFSSTVFSYCRFWFSTTTSIYQYGRASDSGTLPALCVEKIYAR